MTEANSAPIFVIGNPRSGTTLLRLLLAAHPELVVPPECGFLVWLAKDFGGWNAADASDPARVAAFERAVEGCRKFDSWQLPATAVTHELQRRRPLNYAALAATVYWAYATVYKPSARRWGDKNNFHTRHVAELARLYPAAQFVHIVRDLRDVACSYRALQTLQTSSPYRPNLPAAAAGIAADWCDNIGAAEQALSQLPLERVHRVRYEDLVGQPEPTLRQLCSFLQEPYSAAMTEYYRLNLEPAQTLDWKRKTREPVSAEQVGRFRRELPAEEIALLTAAGRVWLEHFAYPLE